MSVDRWSPALAYIGSGEYAPNMEADTEGDYVLFDDYAIRCATLTRERDEARAEIARLTADGAYVLLEDAAQAIADLRRERDQALASVDRVLRAAADVVDRETRVVTDVVLSDIADNILALTPEAIDRIAEEHEHG